MIKCKKCGSENYAYDSFCPECSSQFEPSPEEIEVLLREARRKYAVEDYRGAVDSYKFLAALGVSEAEREFALILERGLLVPRDTDMSAKYFHSAAKKGDPLSAYKYSKTILANDTLSDFWLAYAAIMGCEEAYADAFALYARMKDRETASYYCALLAAEGDVDATVEMARRHLYGDGVEQSESYAKWYCDKLTRTPIHAMKLYRRLQAAELSSEPPAPILRKRSAILGGLISTAKKYGFQRVLYRLTKTFSEGGSPDASVHLAYLYLEGIEFEQNVDFGISLLEDAVWAGSATGAKYLGDLYAEGRHAKRDKKRAAEYYRKAVMLGCGGEFESLGDIFREGKVADPELSLALSIYEAGSMSGDLRCRTKARLMKEDRERSYIEACKTEKVSPEEAFPLFKKSVDAGYLPAHARIGWYYERGIGTAVDRKAAFNNYKAAYESGDKRAIESLGRCYARGIGTAFDFKRASELLSIARDMGSRSADKELYRIYENKKRHMIRSLYSTAMRLYYNKKYDLARSKLEICMQLGLADAAYAIGCLYEFGITTPPDRKTALRLYKKAYDDGYSDPEQSHKQMMLKISKQ